MEIYVLNERETKRFDSADEELIHELLERFGRVNSVNPKTTVKHPSGYVIGTYGVAGT